MARAIAAVVEVLKFVYIWQNKFYTKQVAYILISEIIALVSHMTITDHHCM